MEEREERQRILPTITRAKVCKAIQDALTPIDSSIKITNAVAKNGEITLSFTYGDKIKNILSSMSTSAALTEKSPLSFDRRVAFISKAYQFKHNTFDEIVKYSKSDFVNAARSVLLNNPDLFSSVTDMCRVLLLHTSNDTLARALELSVADVDDMEQGILYPYRTTAWVTTFGNLQIEHMEKLRDAELKQKERKSIEDIFADDNKEKPTNEYFTLEQMQDIIRAEVPIEASAAVRLLATSGVSLDNIRKETKTHLLYNFRLIYDGVQFKISRASYNIIVKMFDMTEDEITDTCVMTRRNKYSTGTDVASIVNSLKGKTYPSVDVLIKYLVSTYKPKIDDLARILGVSTSRVYLLKDNKCLVTNELVEIIQLHLKLTIVDQGVRSKSRNRVI